MPRADQPSIWARRMAWRSWAGPRRHSDLRARPLSLEFVQPRRASWRSRAACDPSPDNLRTFRRRRSHVLLRLDPRHLDPQVYAVSQRPRDPAAIAVDRRRGAAAAAVLGTRVAARTRVHRRDQLEPRRVDRRPADPRDRHMPVLHRLPERLQRGSIELGQLVEKEHAVVGERHFARRHVRAAADHARIGDGVMRGSERPGSQKAADLRPGDRGDDRRHTSLALAERRQQARYRPRQERLARARRPDHDEAVASRQRDLERPPGFELAADLGEIRCGSRSRRPRAARRAHPRPSPASARPVGRWSGPGPVCDSRKRAAASASVSASATSMPPARSASARPALGTTTRATWRRASAATMGRRPGHGP